MRIADLIPRRLAVALACLPIVLAAAVRAADAPPAPSKPPDAKKAAPATVPKAEAATPAKPAPEPAAKPVDKPEAKPAPEPAAKPADKPEAKPAPKPAAKPADKPAAKPVDKPAAKPVDKPEAKPAPEPAAKPEAKPAPKLADKPVDKPEAKPAPKPAAKAADKTEIRFQFDGIPYDDVIRRFAQMAGKPILGEYHVEGTLTFFDPQPYTFDEAFDTLNLLLAMRGYTAVDTPRFLRVVPIKEATKAPLRIVKGWDEADKLRPGQLVTMMLPLKFISAEDAVRVLMPVVSTYGTVAPLGRGRGIIITDRLANMKRIRVVLDELDTGTLSADQQLKTYKLKHASAKDIATIVSNLFPPSRSGSEPKYIRDHEGRYVRNPNYGQPEKPSDMGVKATADQRTNTLFLSGSGENIALAEQIVEQLDAIEPGATGDMRVFDLKNARAEDLANTIKQLLPQQASYSSSHSSSSRSSSSGSQTMQARVVADVNTNRLIVTAPLDQMTAIEELVRTLDQASEEVGGMRVFKLKVADAQQLARVIEGAISRSSDDSRSRYSSSSSRYGSSRSAMSTRVSADTRTNSLIVCGSAGDIRIAEQLITELDKPIEEGEQTREIHVVQLKAGDARELASSLTRMLSQGDPRNPSDRTAANVRIAADAGTNSLLISAAPGDWPTIEKLLEQLKATAVPMATASTRIIPLQHAKARELADSLNRIYESRSHSYGYSRSRSSQPSVPVVISASDRSNCLLVSAADDDQKAIAELVKTMDTPSAEKVDPVHIIQVASGDAAKIAETLRGLLPYPERGRPQTVFVRGDEASNSIVIRAPEAEFKALEQMVQQLDKAITTSGNIRAFRLKVADAQQLAPVVQRAVVKFESGHSHPPDGATVVTADVRTNSLIVAGPAGDIQTAEKLIAELDKPLDEKAREIHVVQLKVGDAGELAQALTRMLAQQSTTGRYGAVSAGNVRVEAESATNSLLISAAPADWPTIEKLLEELKTSAAPLATATTRIVPLKHANAVQLAETLREVYASRGSGSGRSRYSSRGYQPSAGPTTVPVVITASERTNSLLVSAADDDQKAIAELITVLDVPPAEGAEPMRMIRLQSADAVQLADTLKAMVPRPEPGETESVVIEAEPLSNSVLIRGPEADRKMFEEMIATLDKATQQQAREIRRIQLKHVSATQLAQMLGQLYQTTPASSSSYRSSRYGYGRSRPTTGKDERVVIAAAPGDRTLVVDAPRDKIEEIATLVASLDVADSPGQVEVRTYRLTSASAAELAVSLSRLFAQQQQSRSGAAAEGEPEPRFEADMATNQVLVAATPTQFETIDALIKKLEVDTNLARETRTFRLKAAKAADIVDVLQTMLVDTPASSGRYGRGSERTAADVRVAAMPDTNDVVVQGPPEKLALAAELIKTFDAEGPAGQSAIFIVKLKNAQAESLAEAVNSALAAGAGASSYPSRFGPWRGPPRPQQQEDRVTVTPELNSNSVLVRGPAAEIPAVVEMIHSLDQGSTGTGAEVRVYPLENGEPSALAASLGKLFQDMLRQQAGRSRNAPSVPFSIAADDRTQSLVISTTPSHFALVEEILHRLDQAPTALEADVQYVWLANADAVEVAAQLEDMYKTRKGDKPVISADEFSNAITIIAKESDLKVIEPIITKLDKAAEDNSYRVRVIPLTSVKAEKMAQVLRSVYKQMTGNEVTVTTEAPEAAKGPEGESGPGGVEGPGKASAPGADTQEPGDADTKKAPPGVTIAVDKNSNSLIVSGSRQELDYIQDLVEELMLTSMDVDAEFRVFKIEKADPETVARTLDALFNPKPKAPQRGSQQKGPPAPAPPPVINVVADLRTRSVIVRAKPLDFEDVEMLIKQLDQIPTVVSEVRIFPLKNTDATEVAQNLKELFQRAVQRSSAPRPQPRPSSSSSSSKGRPTPQPQQPQEQRVEMIRQVLELRTKQGITQVDIASMVNVSANKQTNSVIVTAPVDAMEVVAGIIEELDQSGMAAVTSIRMYPVKNAEIAPTVTALREVFGGATRMTTAGKRSGRTVLDAEIIITGDEAGRMIIVSAPAEEHKLIESVIREMDDAQGLGDITIKVYRLQNADASSVATALSAMVGRSTSGGTRRSATGSATGGATGSATRASGTGQVQISADRSSNSVVVRAPAEEHLKIAKLIDEMDQTLAAIVKTYPVKNADVQTIVAALTDIFVSRSSAGRGTGAAGGPGGTGAPRVSITGDEAGRLVIVSASAEKHELIGKVIDEIDQAQNEDQVTVKVYRLEHADATDVASALQSTIQKGASASGGGGYWSRYSRPAAAAGQVRINADRSSNSLIVRASAEDHDQIAKLIEQLDVAPSAQYAVRTIPLTNADPTAVAEVLNRVFAAGGQRSSRSSRYGSSGGSYGGSYGTSSSGPRSNVVIEADRDARMLMVRADDETFNKIRELVTQLDAASPGGLAEPVLIPLKFAQASSVAPAVSQAFQPQRGTGRTIDPNDLVTVVAEPVSNSIIVTANAKNMEKVKDLLAKLDSEATAGLRSEMLILEAAKAEDLAPVLEKMAKSSTTATAGASGYGARASTGGQQTVTVSAEKGSNALVISGPSNGVDKIVQMAKDLDKATTSSAAMVRVIPLTNGDAPNVAAMVQDLYRQQSMIATREKRSIDPLAVSSDARANAIVLATSDEMYKQVSEWVAKIEEMQPQRGALKIITLKHADPTEVEQAIQQIFGEAAGRSVTPVRRSSTSTPSLRSRGSRGAAGATGRQGPTGGKVETTVLPQQRSILINASDADYEIIKKLVEALDAAAADARRQYKVFALKNTSNVRIATALTALYRAVPGAAARPEDQVTVTALANTDAVVISATAEKMEEVDHLIQQLDKEEVAPQLEFRIYPLENAQPTKLMPVLQQMLNQVRQMRPDEPLDVQADERTRSVIVTARGPMFDQVETIIKALDKKPAFAETEVLIIPLKHADATRLATVLTDMLRPSATAQVTPEARALQEQVRLLKVRSADGRAIPELDLTKPIKITADPTLVNTQGSNALLISSTPDNLKAMAAIVGVLDRVPLAEGTRVRVVHLKNADAESVAEILDDIFTQGQRLGGKEQTSVEGKAEPDSVTGKALTNPLNVSADLRTNSLVLSGIEESLALADLVIQDLDRDAGKIVTEVRVFRLQYADVARLAPVLQAVFGESPPTAGTEGLKTQVTRLRTVLDKGKGVNVTDVPKARPALTIQADPTTSAIVVAARSDVMPLIADVIKTMDIPGAGSLNVVQIIPLVNADATRLKGVIDGLYTGPNAQFARPEDVPTVQVDTRTNALVVSASEKTFAMIGTLLKGLDAKQPIAMRDIRIVPLKNAEATTIGPVLQQLMDARVQRFATLGAADAEALRVIIMADTRSNSLLIGGSAEGFQLAKSLAEQLDGASPAISGQIQLFPLQHANAGTISTTLQNLFTQRYQAARTVDIQRERPIILPDVRVNALLVAANADDTKVIQGLLKKLDVELQDPSVQLVVIPLEHNDCGIVGPTLQRLFAARLQSMTLPGQTPVPQDRVDVETDPLSNALIVSASKDNLALITGLLKKVDVAPPDETGIVRMYPLQNSDAQRISTMLQGLIAQGLYKPGMVTAGANQLLADREKVSITVDVRTNTLIVSASRENFAVLEEIIRKIDSSEDFSVLGDLRMFTLKNANATRLAPTLQQLFDAKRAAEIAAGGTGRMLPVSVISDARTNTLLVAGSRESFNAIEAMIRELDTDQILAANEFRIFYLKQATATALQPTLEQLFAQRATRGVPSEPVTIVTEIRTNSLIVSASPEDMKLAESIIDRLDAEPDRPGTTVQVFPLAKADASQVAATLTSLYQMPGAAAGPTVGISVDERINAIVVQAGPADQKRIGELVNELDTDTVPRVTEIRVFTLENADATELAAILNDALNQKPTPLTATSPNRQALLQFVTHSADGGKLITSALQEGLLITPDRRSNSLVISAPLENMPLLESLIKAMDSTSPRTAEIRVFTLINSDARAMATVLNELFRMQQTAAGKQAIEYKLIPTEGNEKGPAAVVGSAEDVALTVTVDIRTNSLLVGGTKHYVELASKVIQELDESTAAERLTEVYRLRNAQAPDIEAALTNFLDQERALLEAQLGADGAGTSQYILEREVAIVAEATSNTLLLSASPRYYEAVAQMIEELDQPPPQVLIQVLLAEVTIDETNEFGVEWRAMETWRGHDLTGGTAPAFAASAGLTLNPGFQVSVTGGDVNFMLRAIESQGRLEVLSRPQILASDNQEATINIGQRVPFITNSRVTDVGTTINTIEYQDVGIILNVTPRINPDGFVKLEVNPEISALDDSTVPISEGVNAIIVNSRSAETTVTVQDGHTIIIGGLITTTDRDRVNKVPFLGDIPGLGWLFRSTRKVKERTELLIILTPTVLRNIEEADIETASQVKRLNLLRGTGEKPLKDQPFKEFSDQLWEKVKVAPNGEKADKPAARPSTRIHVPARIEERPPTP